MLGYKHPCRYCDSLVPPDSKVCPFCKKINPIGQFRCPVCRNVVNKNWKVCSSCGLSLEVECPLCGKLTFLSDYCKHCDGKLTVVCPNRKCNIEQPAIKDNCIKCNTKL